MRPGRVELSSLGFVLAREHAGRDEGFLFTLRGGHNGESHNHNDLGALAVFLDGRPVIVDPGRVTYTAHSFSDTLLHFMVVGEPRIVTDTFVEVGPGLLEHGSERVTWEPAPADDPYQRVDWDGRLYRLTFAQSSKIRGGTSRITVRRRTNDTQP